VIHGLLGSVIGATLLVTWGARGLPLDATGERPQLHFENGLRLDPTLTPADYSPRPLQGGSASQTWEYAFQFSGGLRLLVQMRITNLGPGSEHAQLTAAAAWPYGQVPRLTSNGRPRGEWTLSTDDKGFTLGVAQHVVKISSDRHHLTLRSGSGAYDIDAVPTIPPYRAGRVSLGRSNFYDLTIVAPRLRVRGTQIEPDGSRRDLGEGGGIMVHTRTNVADYDRALAMFGFHSFDEPAGLSFLEFTAARTRERLGLLLLIEDGHVRAWPGAIVREFAGLEPEAASPRYPIPTAFTLSGVDLAGRASLRLLRRDDLLSQISSPLFRFIVGQHTHPVQYVFSADYRVSWGRDSDARTVAGAGLASLSVLNAPPSGRSW